MLDPISPSTVASNALTTFILGGKTQVQRALDARPTFATIWIGGNNVLQAAYTGILVPTPGVSNGIVGTQAEFQASYDAMIKQLLDSMPGLKGVLIGVPDASSIPLMSSGALIASSPRIRERWPDAGQPSQSVQLRRFGGTRHDAALLASSRRIASAAISCQATPARPTVSNLFV